MSLHHVRNYAILYYMPILSENSQTTTAKQPSSRLYRKVQGEACTELAGTGEIRNRWIMVHVGQWWGSTRHRMEQAMRIRIRGMRHQGEAWPSFGKCEGVFISCKFFSPADGHPWQLRLHRSILVIATKKTNLCCGCFLCRRFLWTSTWCCRSFP